ncbi:hypothetical protein AhaeINNSZ174_03595 [Acinetobacter haemolyticus]|uniref:hypothetical protein n=1 Tax=Acinetobacter haemolyticus TaxID=29430 RepID=UPI001331F40F|nr:hypothetical protein [Acinetobacter haemolyticus]QHI28623.1 hypothetical protein AhaeINNSZ174_03595 [Acinetobacter haemolyticus]
MAKYAGKGWFAILLSGEISAATKIPEYIMDALIFSRGDYSALLLADIIKYRLKIHEVISPGLYDFSSLYKLLERIELGDKVELSKILDELVIIRSDQAYIFLSKFIKEFECV